MFQKVRNLRKNKKRILGRNEWYLKYIRPNNLTRSLEIADDKIITKQILTENEIPTPTLMHVIKSKEEIDSLDFELLPKSFVIKPAQGFKGGGIEIFYNQDKNGLWIRADKSKASIDYIKSHMMDIIDGRYSLHNQPDTVMIEERVKPHKAFRYHTFKGTPDVRVIVFNSVPVMAMLRLPTEKSGGKANLDKGAIGAGIDMAIGKTTYGVPGKGGLIERIPHTGLPVSGLRVPYWNKILEYSIKASKVTGLGFAGIDLLIDREEGPKIVEVNARPGLSIQFANRDGMRRRLRKVAGLNVKSIDQGIRLSKDLFGGEIEEGIEMISGKNVIGIYENVKLFGLEDKVELAKAKIDTGADRTSIDIKMAKKLGFEEIINEVNEIDIPEEMSVDEARTIARQYEEKLLKKYTYMSHLSIVKSSHGVSLRISVNLELKIDETKFETIANIFDRSGLTYPVIIGRKSLYKFLVDPSK